MKTVLEYLEATASRIGNKTAVIDSVEAFTWQELQSRSLSVGSSLSKVLSPGTPVPVFMEKGVHTLSAFMGSVYAGAFYVPLNPQLPDIRLRQILKLLDPPCIVTDEPHQMRAESLLGPEKTLLVSSLEDSHVDIIELMARRKYVIDTDPVYANFTSGSTGVPKGVVVSHRSVLDFIDHFTELFSINEEDVLGNQAPFDFDVSVKDLYSALKTGATLVIIPRDFFSRPVELLDYLDKHGVTTLIWAVSALCLVTTFHGLEYKTPKSVQKILFSGETMPVKHLKSWMEHFPEATFVNLYGPTEITCNCTYHIIERNRDYTGGIPIGIPFPNERVLLLDREDHLIQTPDVIGEICVAGSALALGYYRAPEQTAAQFVINPLNPGYPEKIYRTGDLGYFNEHEELFFTGRKDFQIKYLGHRIELEEIERAMSALDGVDRACCIFDERRNRLYGYYVGNLDREMLFLRLSEILPAYMVPGRLIALPEMPLTQNGKIDRRTLIAKERRRG